MRWDRQIIVPFAPETARSGVNERGFFRACWYRREFTLPDDFARGDHLLLHFGAVDYHATVWVDGWLAGRHEGGYTPFTFDITDCLGGRPGSPGHEIVVLAEDDPCDLAKPRGKQDWRLLPHAIWYYRTTGIWQTVWLERVGATWIDRIRWSCTLERWEIGLEAMLAGAERDDLTLNVRLESGGRLLAEDRYGATGFEVHRRIALTDPGIDDYRNELLWTPSTPTLINAVLELRAGATVLDQVHSYTALRSVAVQGERIVLNGRPYPLRMVLDQGYWPDTGATAPDDAALRHDVELAKAMGFNGVRKHQKLEDPRYLYWADHLGLLVWGEMPSAYRFTKESIRRVLQEWTAAIERDYSHPCVVAWVPLNESWGVPNLPENPAERHYVQALYHLTKTLDPTRPVVGNDGWESVATDIIGVHDYESPERIARRYRAHEGRPNLFRRERPGGRLLVVGEQVQLDHPVILSEFGGIALANGKDPAGWGYSRCANPREFAQRYRELMEVIHLLELLAGFCYTQFADTYQEINGLLYADRTPKIPLETIAAATRGIQTELEMLSETMETDAGQRVRSEP